MKSKAKVFILCNTIKSAQVYARVHGFDMRRCVVISHPAQLCDMPASQVIVLPPYTYDYSFNGRPLWDFISPKHSVAYDSAWGATSRHNTAGEHHV